MTLDKSKLEKRRGFLEGTSSLVDKETADCAASYKKEVSKKYISINPGQIDERLGGTVFYVSRKYDGELAIVFWNGTDCFSINSGGTVRMGLPCLEDAAKCFKAAGLKSAVIAAELYKNEEKGRNRVFDVKNCLGDEALHNELRLALFDIVSIDDDDSYKNTFYKEIYDKLAGMCKGSGYVHPVRFETTGSREQVKEIFSKWVDEEGSEGLVVRSELPMVYKVKNRHNLDAAVIGFSEGTGDTKGQVRSLLLALMAEDGNLEVVGRCSGSAIEAERRKSLYLELLDMKAESDYTEIDSNHIAFHMIRPEMVIELSVNDIIFEGSSGRLFNPHLEYKNGAYSRRGTVPGVSLISPVFSRFREDKKVNDVDIRRSQIDEINANPYEDAKTEDITLSKSELLKREVYKKTLGTKLMVQKFIIWKTNKEKAAGSEFPAYVFSYTNFSSDRADVLQNEVRVSDSEEQIFALLGEFVEKNVKKGWEKQ